MSVISSFCDENIRIIKHDQWTNEIVVKVTFDSVLLTNGYQNFHIFP